MAGEPVGVQAVWREKMQASVGGVALRRNEGETIDVFEQRQICPKGRVSRAGPREINQEGLSNAGGWRDQRGGGWRQANNRKPVLLLMEGLNQSKADQRERTSASRDMGLLSVLFTVYSPQLGYSWPQ